MKALVTRPARWAMPPRNGPAPAPRLHRQRRTTATPARPGVRSSAHALRADRYRSIESGHAGLHPSGALMMDRPLFQKNRLGGRCGQMFRNHPHMDSISALLAFVRTAEAGIVGAARVPACQLRPSASASPGLNRNSARACSSAPPAACISPTKANCCCNAAGVRWMSFPKRRRTWRSDSTPQRTAAHRPAHHRLPLPAAGAARLPATLSAGAAGTGLQRPHRRCGQRRPDAVIRSGELADSSLTARRLGGFRFILCAAPGYLQMHGTPGDVGDLRMHTRCASVTPPPESCIRGSCRASKATPGRAFPRR